MTLHSQEISLVTVNKLQQLNFSRLKNVVQHLILKYLRQALATTRDIFVALILLGTNKKVEFAVVK